MGECHLFGDERVELLDGIVVRMSPQDSAHAGVVHRVLRALERALGEEACVRCRAPIVLDDFSEPEPDVAVCRLDPGDYTRAHPSADAVLLVVEVASSSLSYDRNEKRSAYARGGISEYWIVDLSRRRVEVYADPHRPAAEYRRMHVVAEPDLLRAPGGASVACADLLPPPVSEAARRAQIARLRPAW
jgi:Uma2 family endonuclease